MSWNRPPLDVRAPDRSAGGLYRSADRPAGSDAAATETLAGVPLQTVSDAVVATVRLGYRIADREIERSRRLSQQLRSAAGRAGADDPEQWLDQTEKLLAKLLQAGGDWAEGAATLPPPLLRLLRAEGRLLLQWLRLLGGEPPVAAPAPAADPPAPGAAAAPPPGPALDLLLACPDPMDRRAVRLVHARWSALPDAPLALWFHARGGAGADPMAGELSRAAGRDRLLLHTRRHQPEGTWRAAVCLADGQQIGVVEVEL